MKLYPTIEEVFENPSENYKFVFLPLLTIDLEEHNLGKGLIHFVSVLGNGDPDLSYDEGNIDFNYVRFQRKGDKYRFNGNVENLENFEVLKECYTECYKEFLEHREDFLIPRNHEQAENSTLSRLLKEKEEKYDYYAIYAQCLFSYWITRENYQRTGKFISSSYFSGYSGHEREIYEEIGGELDEYIVEYVEEILNEGEQIQDKKFIGWLTGFNYFEHGEDELYLLLDEKKEEIILYAHWS